MFLMRKLPISPTAEQEAVLWELAECCRLVYNHALFERKFVYEHMDRDQNSAVNLMVRFLSRHALWTDYQVFLDNLQYFFDSQPGKRELSLLLYKKVEVDSQEAPFP